MAIARLRPLSIIAGVAFSVCGCSASQTLPQPSGAAALLPAKHRVTISQFADLPVYYDYYGPSAVAAGPHRSLWVTETIDQDFGENAVVEIATSGKALHTYYYTGKTSEGSDLVDLVEGPDGALWITDEYNQQILRMTAGGKFTSYPLTTSPWVIVNGPDKAIWFAENSGIGRITTSGAIQQYSATGTPYGICAGPDGALWFTEPRDGVIGRITTAGKITYYSQGISSGSYPLSIAAGPDGALWFTEYSAGKIGRITTAGTITEFSKGLTAGELPVGIAQGPDGAMWFTASVSRQSYSDRNAKIGRITPDGKIKEYDKFDTSSDPTTITEGADKNMWFTEAATNEMGRVNL